MRKKWLWWLVIGLMLIVALVACQPQTEQVVVTRVVEDTVVEEVTRVVEGEETVVEVTRVVEREVQVEPTEPPIPQGGFIIESSFADASQLNPILSADSASSDVNSKLYLGLVTLHEETGEIIGQIAESWEVSEDGLTYTFHLRDDIVWSDGEPLTAEDVKFTYDAIASDLVETPRKSNVELVDSMEVVDDYTLEVNFTEIDCTALQNFTLGVLPAHAFADDFSDIMDSPENSAPSVTSGPFVFSEHEADSFVTLLANPDYYEGAPNVEGWTYRIFADQSAELEALLAGETDVTTVSPQFVSVVEGAIAEGDPLQMKKFFDDGYTYIGFNMANPDNPQPGWEDLDEDGEYDPDEPPLEQEPHPVFSDRAVRLAISHAIDYTNIINRVVFGEGTQAVSNVLPAVEWAYDESLQPYEFDTEMAAQILTDAGWEDTNGDGIREKDGQQLRFTLMTNAGNEVRENIAQIVKDTLESEELGFAVDLEIIEFGTVVENLLGQTFDAVIIGWTGLGSDPEDSSFWAYRNDSPGGGFNFVSYYNEEVEEKLNEARSLPGCGVEERGQLYRDIQTQILDDAPYTFLYVPLTNVVWNTRLEGIDPQPWSTYYNVEGWYLMP